ncbi:hypothetical protein ACG2F4_13960 [Halalkalibaculum sp. DA3122]|uniref:hypothetical protein n=1 Tax=Halalkalibaculum sp. DA3122 TaxID=3373607 RepID=UPI003753F592
MKEDTSIFRCIRFVQLLILLGFAIHLAGCESNSTSERYSNQYIKGWNILSDNEQKSQLVIDHLEEYDINHLQISHQIVMDLKDVRNTEKRQLTNELTKKAHEKGVEEVVVWDHALYDLDYYPDRFKTGPDRTINLDNPEFWKWVKQDYRDMLDMVPGIDGIVLTFIETGAHVEDQYSKKLETEGQKLAALVDTLSSVIIDERDLSLYARTFFYTKQEMRAVLDMVELIEHDEITIMMKESPHDFIMTHPNNRYVERVDRPVLVEFDPTGEFHGQSIVAGTFAEHIRDRWSYFLNQSNVVGYVARTDRFGTTQILNRTSELNLYTLHALQQNPDLDLDRIYEEFITQNYGKKAVPPLKLVFQKAEDITKSVFYSLGLNTANHSRLDFDYPSIYGRHVSGKWLENPVADIAHNVDTTLHYWNEVVNHLSPPRYKEPDGPLKIEAHWVVENGWVEPGEKMTMEYLRMVVREKNYGVELARKALQEIENAEPYIESSQQYDKLYQTFRRTLITARLRRGAAKSYYGYRLYNRGAPYQTEELKEVLKSGLQELAAMADTVEAYPHPHTEGQWNWWEDAEDARELYRKVNSDGYEPYGSTGVQLVQPLK